MVGKPESTIRIEDPPELVAFVDQEAQRDADDVAAFLSDLGMRGPGARQLLLPASFLLGLGAAMRLLRWEAQGFQPHRTAGLSSALNAIMTLVQLCHDASPAERDQHVVAFCLTVFRIANTSFAWEGQSILRADIQLGEPDEEALLDAFALLVWQMHKKR